MKGWNLFMHSVRMVFGNLGMAAQVSLVLYAIYAVTYIGLMQSLGPEMLMLEGPAPVLPSSGFWLKLMGVYVVSMVLITWVAVAWHRYVLLGEAPTGWVPAWPGSKILGYLLRSILLGLVVMAVMIIIGFVIGFLAAALGMPSLSVLIVIIGLPLSLVMAFRLSAILPAGAVGKPMGLKDAWQATSGQSGTVFLMAIFLALGSVIVSLPSLISENPYSMLNLIYTMVTGWFMAMVSVSVLTTLYGHFVEGRDLD